MIGTVSGWHCAEQRLAVAAVLTDTIQFALSTISEATLLVQLANPEQLVPGHRMLSALTYSSWCKGTACFFSALTFTVQGQRS
jgi:hypothetical protein